MGHLDLPLFFPFHKLFLLTHNIKGSLSRCVALEFFGGPGFTNPYVKGGGVKSDRILGISVSILFRGQLL